MDAKGEQCAGQSREKTVKLVNHLGRAAKLHDPTLVDMDEQTIGILAQNKIKSVICCSGNRLMKTNIRHVATLLLHLRRLVLESGCSNEVNSAGIFSDLQVLKASAHWAVSP